MIADHHRFCARDLEGIRIDVPRVLGDRLQCIDERRVLVAPRHVAAVHRAPPRFEARVVHRAEPASSFLASALQADDVLPVIHPRARAEAVVRRG